MCQNQDFPFNIEYVAELLHLRIRRICPDGAYADCPICGDNRGKMKLNYEKNVWRCNYCNNSGGMLKLYASVKNITMPEANREICETILNGDIWNNKFSDIPEIKVTHEKVQSSSLADISVIHNTFKELLGMLRLSEQHREHLRSKRGLTDEEIDRLGYKSTPPFYMCKNLTNQLIGKGCIVEGVPGFYIKNGEWTVNFSSILSGILIPVHGVDGMIRGCQIRLDIPLKNDDNSDKDGAKYVWLSSSGKTMGTSSGSPIHYVGRYNSKVVYLTEGTLKADIASILMNRTFVAIAGINNTSQLELLFAYLAKHGTETVIIAADMDRFRNENVSRGVSNISIMAKQHGLESRLLVWNPNYKGVDDWQLALKRKISKTEENVTHFKERFIYAISEFDDIHSEIAIWQKEKQYDCKLQEYLGLNDEEYNLCVVQDFASLKNVLLSQRKRQNYRIYQLDLSNGRVIPFAFGGVKYLHKAGYEYPPASEYRLVEDDVLLYGAYEDEHSRLTRIADIYGDELPNHYIGRSVAPSDVIELYDDKERKYFYRDEDGFFSVKFSPMLAKLLTNTDR